MRQVRDLTGTRFGKLSAIKLVLNAGPGRHTRWQCRCDCGKKAIIRSDVLVSGFSNSCGCATASFISQANIRHGQSNTPTYRAWINMVRRCINPNVAHFDRYGGRGIRVCRRWRKFENFLEDMGLCPDGLSIERLNNNGHYNLANCCWASAKDQARNRRNTKFVLLHGERMPLTMAAERLGISPHSLRANVRRGNFVEGIVT